MFFARTGEVENPVQAARSAISPISRAGSTSGDGVALHLLHFEVAFQCEDAAFVIAPDHQKAVVLILGVSRHALLAFGIVARAHEPGVVLTGTYTAPAQRLPEVTPARHDQLL
jgi:hypothetical protein